MNLPEEQAKEVTKRLEDYGNTDATEQREKLIRLWRKHHPAAAKEKSVALHPLMCIHTKQPGEAPENPDSEWANDVYNVTFRWRQRDTLFNTDSGIIQLGISALDGTARHDWREFQAIKNQLAGEECEAFELYPAESRLLDPSNYYSLWCFPGLKHIRLGYRGPRDVRPPSNAIAPQREFPDK
jgi:hypothetical protein